MIVLLVVFEALLVDLEQLLAHETLIVSHLHIARLTIEHALLLRQETFARDWLLACHARHIRDFFEIAQDGKVQFARASSILIVEDCKNFRLNVLIVMFCFDLFTFSGGGGFLGGGGKGGLFSLSLSLLRSGGEQMLQHSL